MESKTRKVMTFIKGVFGKIQMFNTRNVVGDRMVRIYDKHGVQIDYCRNYDYIEVFGLAETEFIELEKKCGR